jgi:CHASE3 domain sensor protein
LGLRRSDNWSSFKGGIVLVLAVLLANGLISYRILRQLVSNNQLVVHTLHVINELDATLSILKDAENGQRGYLITSDATYLNRYRQAASEVFTHIDGIDDQKI